MLCVSVGMIVLCVHASSAICESVRGEAVRCVMRHVPRGPWRSRSGSRGERGGGR